MRFLRRLWWWLFRRPRGWIAGAVIRKVLEDGSADCVLACGDRVRVGGLWKKADRGRVGYVRRRGGGLEFVADESVDVGLGDI